MHFLGPAGVAREQEAVAGLSPQHPDAPVKLRLVKVGKPR